MSDVQNGDGREVKDVDPLAKTVGIGCLGVVALFVAIFVIGSLFGDDAGETSPYEAEQQCERFIADRLKSPSSAEFDLNTVGGPTTFTSTGTVDSQNSFGAMVRNEVSCTIRVDGDVWRLEGITGLTN